MAPVDGRFRWDLEVENHGSIWLFRPLRTSSNRWLLEHVGEDSQFGNALVCEPRHVEDLLRGVCEAGFRVRVLQ
jgi:hypothetical protein